MNTRLLEISLKTIARLPYQVVLAFGRLVGTLAFFLGAKRRRIARINLEKCFPELNTSERRALLKAQFQATGMGLLEAAFAWYGDEKRVMSRCAISGRDHLEQALAQGKGVILLTFHYPCLDLAGIQLSHEYPVGFMQRPHNDPEMDKIITGGRMRYAKRAVSRHSPRDMLKALKEHLIVCYYPDHDLGRKASEFAPFFGVQTAWVSAISRMAQMSGAPVVPMLCERLPKAAGLHLRLLPALEQFPSEDVVADLTRVSQLLETHLREHPENYLWTHRRFKTRPEGEASFYARQ